jgi:uncharacterized membrane protein YeaQ/YmgE (transglycosylase-associated protein family)
MGIGDILLMALLGLVVGAVAKFLMPGRDPGGCVVTMIIGFIGSLIGGVLASLIGLENEGGFIKFIFAVVGAVILLVLYRVIIGKRPGM